jgi:hypothetical protein
MISTSRALAAKYQTLSFIRGGSESGRFGVRGIFRHTLAGFDGTLRQCGTM